MGENFISLTWPITVFVNFDVLKIVRKSVVSILPYKGVGENYAFSTPVSAQHRKSA